MAASGCRSLVGNPMQRYQKRSASSSPGATRPTGVHWCRSLNRSRWPGLWRGFGGGRHQGQHGGQLGPIVVHLGRQNTTETSATVGIDLRTVRLQPSPDSRRLLLYRDPPSSPSPSVAASVRTRSHSTPHHTTPHIDDSCSRLCGDLQEGAGLTANQTEDMVGETSFRRGYASR